MADEVIVQSWLKLRKGHLEYTSRPTAFKADLRGDRGPSPGAMLVPTTGKIVTFRELAEPEFCFLQNLDTANYVEWGVYEPSTGAFYPLGELGPGEGYALRLSRNLQEEYQGSGTGTTGPANRFYLKANTAACAVLLDAFGSAPLPTDPLTEPFAYYAGGDLNDATDHARHLTGAGGVTFPAGKVNLGIGLEAALSQYGHRTDSDFAFAGSWGGCLWVKLASKPGNMALVDRYDSGATAGYVLFYDGGSDSYQFWGADGTNIAAVAGTAGWPTVGTWQHLGFRYQAPTRTLFLYENGVLAGSATLPGTLLHSAGIFVALGASGQGTVSFLDGTLDEVPLYDYDFGAAGVTYHFNGGAGLTWPLA